MPKLLSDFDGAKKGILYNIKFSLLFSIFP